MTPRVPNRIARIVGLSFVAFAIIGSYEIARPATESLFVEQHAVRSLPKVWLLVAIGVTLAVAAYNRVVARVALDRMIGLCAIVSGVGLVAVRALGLAEVPGWTYLLYVWKDVYIVVMVEVFWSFANTVFPLKSARWVYGLLCASGSLGAIAGVRLLRWATPQWGTENALWLVLPVLGLVWLFVQVLRRFSVVETQPVQDRSDETPLKERVVAGIAVLRSSHYLVLLLVLVVGVQVITNLVDFQFHDVMATTFPDRDIRTVRVGQVYEYISYCALALQLLTGVVVRMAGVGGVMVGIPLLIGVSVTALAISPVFAVAAAAKIVGKSLDYSLFRAAKEMLYIPLNYAEKTQGKAVIDMLGYRVAKGGAALVLQALLAMGLGWMLGGLTVVGSAVWLVLAVVIVRRYRARSVPRGR